MALYFDGSSGIEFANPRIPDPEAPFTFAMAFYPTRNSVNETLFAQYREDDGGFRGMFVWLPNASDNLSIDAWIFRDSTSRQYASPSSTIKLNRWNYLLWRYQGTGSNAYSYWVNGTSISPSVTNGSGNYLVADGLWRIGINNGHSTGFQGHIAYVAIWDTYISETWENFQYIADGGISPELIAHNYLKFYIRLTDPNNIIDKINGKKGGIFGTISHSEVETPRISY